MIEILIAMLLFFLLVKYTTVFDKLGQAQNVTIWTNNTGSIATWIIITSSNTTSSSNHWDINNIITYNNPWKSCSTPRWEKISDWEAIVAYSNSRSTSNNTCNSEIRSCVNGRLWGSYTNKKCEYMVDWKYPSNTNNQIVYAETYQNIKPVYIPPAQEYIQPITSTDTNKQFTIYWQRGKNTDIIKPTAIWTNGTMKYPIKNKWDWNP